MVGQFRISRVAVMTLALAGLSLPAASYAQDKPVKQDNQDARQPAQRPNRGQQGESGAAMLQRLREQFATLDLTVEQKAQVEKILAGMKEQVEALRADAQTNRLPQTKLRQRMQALMQETREKVMQVLTPEQRQNAKEQMAQAGPLAILERIQKMAAQVNLTPDQKTKIGAIITDVRDQAKAIHDKAPGDQQAAMQEMQKLIRESREKVMQLLTPEQSQKLTDLLKERPMRGDGTGRANGRQRANRPDKPVGDGEKPAQ